MSGLPLPDLTTTQIATGVSPTPTRYDALAPEQRQALRAQQDADPTIHAFLQRTQISTDLLGISQELSTAFGRGTKYTPGQSSAEEAMHHNAVVNTDRLMQEGMRRYINENSDQRFNPADAEQEVRALDGRLHQGVMDATQKDRTPEEVIANCTDHPDWQDPAHVADRLEGYAAVALAKGDITKTLTAIREAQIRRGMPAEIEVGDWLSVISEARTPIGAHAWAFNDRMQRFDSEMKNLGLAFVSGSKTYSIS